jgi:hypothetical protein
VKTRGVAKQVAEMLGRTLLSGALLMNSITAVAAAESTQNIVGPAQTVPPTFFGMHIHRAGNPVPWPSVPIGSWRFWDAHVAWADMAPRKGEFHFEYVDRYLALAEEHNADVLYPLGLTPRWASSRPDEKSAYQAGWAAEPRDIEDWRSYVSAVVQHCKGRVHAYEIWNEPNYKPFWTGDVDGVLRLTREASQIIRKLDPQAIIVSPAATTAAGTKWLAEFLSKGGGQYVDVIGYHFYVNTQPPENMLPIIQQVKQIMADNGQAAKPLWNTEIGWLKPSQFASEELCAAYLARTYILAWAAGVQRTYWYAWDSGPPLEMVEHDFRTLKPAGKAYGVMHGWLVGARVNGCRLDADSTWTCELNRSGVAQWVVWNAAGAKKFSVPGQWHAKSFTPLLEDGQAISSGAIDAGPVPVLITPASAPARAAS